MTNHNVSVPDVTGQTSAESKRMVALRYRLLGMAALDPHWYLALDALEFANEMHAGQTRKRGGPYITHPVAAANYLLTLRPSLLHPVESTSVMLLHDVGEDCGVKYADLKNRFNTLIADGVATISKEFEGTKKSHSEYILGLANCVVGSICKPADRIHNQSTMAGAFSDEKRLQYCDETEADIYPIIKTGRRKFARQEAAYENCSLILHTQIAAERNRAASMQKSSA